MHAVGHALSIAGSMTWQIAWALILGFTLSAIEQALVRRSTIARLLGDDRPRTLAMAAALGAASSSCSYAAVALARSLFRKGASFTAAIAFEIASTNLVIELGVILALLMGWQFTLAEFTGGPIMIVVLAVLFRLFLREKLLREAREQAGRGLAGSMEGHAAMDMSVQGDGSFLRRLLSRAARGRGDRRLGAGLVLAGVLLRRPSAGREGVGPAHRACRGDLVVRLLDRQRAAGRLHPDHLLRRHGHRRVRGRAGFSAASGWSRAGPARRSRTRASRGTTPPGSTSCSACSR